MHGFDGEEKRPVSLPNDLPAIEAIIRERSIGLVVIDHVTDEGPNRFAFNLSSE